MTAYDEDYTASKPKIASPCRNDEWSPPLDPTAGDWDWWRQCAAEAGGRADELTPRERAFIYSMATWRGAPSRRQLEMARRHLRTAVRKGAGMIDARIPIEGEIARRGIQLKRAGGAEFIGPCPVCGGTDRFSINTKKQIWNCRRCAKGGDVIELVRHLDSCGFREAVRTLGVEERPDMPPPKPAQRPADHDVKARMAKAGAIWREAIPIGGTLAERYLVETRKLVLPPDVSPRVLRFHPRCPFGPGAFHPCLIGLFTTIVGGRPIAVHRTALTPDARKIDRRTLGPISAAAIKLSDDSDVTMGLHVAEGIETTIAAMMRGFAPAWALASAVGISKFPVLNGIASLTIIVDHDEPDARGRQAGHAAARQVAERWMTDGREVRSVVPRRIGSDMADLVTEVAP